MTDDRIDKWAAAADHLLKLAVLLAEEPGVIRLDELPNWLRMTAAERERQGDTGAAELLNSWADRLEDQNT
ncbi:hypothetical protein [Paracoccus siganidrum]|uniref:Uncharacterized protein n=1 Tax=Paracoccus siganidrum TaxID=1276757 RepID=A0A419A4F7_9RHOB|nr:hypothetical protein [Paracoccus siganidrum]RJL09144.1 hypothetical protein D3P05_15225 [Paracoccus siganidrum]RMC26534.1 hypothetical protein C9E82_22485 [Paracoccus siganidrum]